MLEKLPEWTDSPILIGGHQKSGTNLVLSLLDRHSELVVFGPGHLHLFDLNMTRVSSLRGEERTDFVLELPIVQKLHDGFIPPSTTVEDAFDFEVFESHLRSLDADFSWDTIVRHIFVGYRKALNIEKGEIRGFVENTPGTEHDLDIASAFFPDAKLIHVIRDPRDVWNSWKDAGKEKNPRSIWSFLKSWVRSAVAGIENLRTYGDSYHVVDYNALVTQTEAEMAAIADFCGISNDEILHTPTKVGVPWGGNSMHTEEFDGVSQDSVGKFKTGLSQREVEMIEAVCLPLYDQIVGQSSPRRPNPSSLCPFLQGVNPLLYRDQNDNVSPKRYAVDLVTSVYRVQALTR